MVTGVGRAFAIAAVAVFAIATVGYTWAWSVDVAAETDDPYLAAKYGAEVTQTFTETLNSL